MNERIYYHFLSTQHAICDLEERRMKVGILDTLNDPHEFMPYRRYGFEKRQRYKSVFKAIVKEWGVLCFSETWEPLLLWAHYAEAHKGVALGFAIPEGRLKKVCYSSSYYRPKVELTDSATDNERRFLDLATVKSLEWAYEQEHRLVVKLKDCCCDDEKERLYFKSFGDDLELREVVLGCGFPGPHNKTQASQVVALANRSGVKVIHTRPGWENYRILPDGSKN